MAKKVYKDSNIIKKLGEDNYITVAQKLDETVRRTQTYQVTHEGELRLPFMERSFISFSFGGKYIEDFGIIRVTGGERLTDNLYADFEDIAEEYDVLDGQFYWGTHNKPLELSYTLSTDEMTQRQLDEFKAWFAPGKIRELVRAQHPNRAILARVSVVPSMNMLPFRGQEQKKIAGTKYKIPTTVYKGDITLSFIAQQPFWYSICNLFGDRYAVKADGTYFKPDEHPSWTVKYYEYCWKDANGQLVATLKSDDALKIILQDNIPSANMIHIYKNLFLGGNSMVLNYQNIPGDQDTSGSSLVGNEIHQNHPPYAKVNVSRIGILYAPDTGTFTWGQSGIDLIDSSDAHAQSAYVYYAGNAISYPTLHFTLIPIFSSVQPYYIEAPGNSYIQQSVLNMPAYHMITIECEKKHQFRFSTPSAWSGYNQAMYWAYKLASQDGGVALEDFRIMIRDYVNHWGARAWAIAIIECFDAIGKKIMVKKSGTLESNQVHVNDFYYCMKLFLSTNPSSTIANYPGSFNFNSKTGASNGIIKYRTVGSLSSITDSSSIAYIKTQLTGFSALNHEENVGDMVRSNYLFLQETNYPDEHGYIQPWSNQQKKNTHIITTNYPKLGSHIQSGETIYDAGMTNFSIQFKNMYR